MLCIHEDRDSRLWFGIQDGLNRLDRATGKFDRFGRESGFPDNTIFGILEDDKGFLWLSTNDGLVEFQPKSGIVRSYAQSNGLHGNSFFYISYCRTREGEMWFGGFNGVNRFHPVSIESTTHIPPVVLTTFRQGGAPPRFPKALERLDKIQLDWRDNFFEFEFAALCFARPEKNRYQYILEEFDMAWSAPSARRYGRYTNLPAGNYRLRLKGTNNDGLWNIEGRAIDIIVGRRSGERRSSTGPSLALSWPCCSPPPGKPSKTHFFIFFIA